MFAEKDFLIFLLTLELIIYIFFYFFFQTKKNPTDHIKRPMNAFMVYSQIQRNMILKKKPDANNAGISKQNGVGWRGLTASEQQPYIAEAEKLRLLHLKEFPDYKYKPQKKPKATTAAAVGERPSRVTKRKYTRKAATNSTANKKKQLAVKKEAEDAAAAMNAVKMEPDAIAMASMPPLFLNGQLSIPVPVSQLTPSSSSSSSSAGSVGSPASVDADTTFYVDYPSSAASMVSAASPYGIDSPDDTPVVKEDSNTVAYANQQEEAALLSTSELPALDTNAVADYLSSVTYDPITSTIVLNSDQELFQHLVDEDGNPLVLDGIGPTPPPQDYQDNLIDPSNLDCTLAQYVNGV